MRHTARRRPGFTLMEMLAVMGVLPIVIGFGGLMLLLAMRSSTTAAATLRSIVVRSQLADRFRTDVGQAMAAPETWREWKQSTSCLILRMPDDAAVVYQSVGPVVERWQVRGDAVTRTSMPAGSHDSVAEFEIVPRGTRRIAVLVIREERFHNRVWELEIAAPLGGDRP